MNEEKDIDYILETELSPDRYCYIHNYIIELQQENKQLKSILSELGEWLNEEKQIAEENIIESKKWLEIEEEKEHAKSDIHTGTIIRRYMQYGLNKIQELKEKYK